MRTARSDGSIRSTTVVNYGQAGGAIDHELLLHIGPPWAHLCFARFGRETMGDRNSVRAEWLACNSAEWIDYLSGTRASEHGRHARADPQWSYPNLTAEATAKNGGWPPPGDGAFNSGIALGPDGTIYAATGSSKFVAVGQDRKLKWEYRTHWGNKAAPVVADGWDDLLRRRRRDFVRVRS